MNQNELSSARLRVLYSECPNLSSQSNPPCGASLKMRRLQVSLAICLIAMSASSLPAISTSAKTLPESNLGVMTLKDSTGLGSISPKIGDSGIGEDNTEDDDEEAGEGSSEDNDEEDDKNKNKSVWSSKSKNSNKHSSSRNSATLSPSLPSNKHRVKEKVSSDDIIDELLRPPEASTTTLRPFMKNRNTDQGHTSNKDRKSSDRKNERGPGRDSCESDSDNSGMEKALKKVVKAGQYMGDTIKDAMTSIGVPLKRSRSTGRSSPSCRRSKSKSSGMAPMGQSSSSSLETEDSSESMRKSSGPILGPSSPRRRSRSVDPQKMTLSSDTKSSHEHRLIDPRLSKNSKHNLTAHGGVITKGKVGPTRAEEPHEYGSGENHSGSREKNTAESAQSSEEDHEDNGSEEKDDSGWEREREGSQESSRPSNRNRKDRGRRGNSNSRGNGDGKNAKRSMHRDVSWTVGSPDGFSGSSATIGSPYMPQLGSSSGNSIVNNSPSFNGVWQKPGKCKPLSGGLSCMTMSAERSQCSSDSGCPGSKKCCYYGCAPYDRVGMCEFPILHG